MSRVAAARVVGLGLAVCLALAAGVWIGARTGAATTPPPGSAADPLVTRSYVTKAITGVLAEAGGRLRSLPAGETFTLDKGTAVVLLYGSATAASGRLPTGYSLAWPPVPLVDLSAGRPLLASVTAKPAAIPAYHLLLTGMAGDTVSAGAHGAEIWLFGAEATASRGAAAAAAG